MSGNGAGGALMSWRSEAVLERHHEACAGTGVLPFDLGAELPGQARDYPTAEASRRAGGGVRQPDAAVRHHEAEDARALLRHLQRNAAGGAGVGVFQGVGDQLVGEQRSEEHTSELQSLMRISYAVFCLKKKNEYTKQ